MFGKTGEKISLAKLTIFVVLLDVFLAALIFLPSGIDGKIVAAIHRLKIGTDKIGEISGRIFVRKQINDFEKESGLSLAGKLEDVQRVVGGESGVVLGEEDSQADTGSSQPGDNSQQYAVKYIGVNITAEKILSALDHDLTYEQIAQRGVRRWNLNVGAVNSKKIVDHSIEARDIDDHSVNSRTLADTIEIQGNFTVRGAAFFSQDVSMTGDVSAATGTITTLDGTTITYTTANLTTIDLGTNTIIDGNFTGDWDFNSGDLSGLGDVYITGHLGVGASPLTDSRIYAEIQGDAAEGRIAINGEAVNGGSNAYWIKGVMGTGWAAGGGTVDYATGLEANVGASAGSTITTGYGVFIDEISGTVTNKFALYQEGTGDINYFAGNVGIGTTTPSYRLDIADSTTLRGLNIANSTALSYGLYAAGTKYGAYGSDGTTSGYLGYDDTYGLYTANSAYIGGNLTMVGGNLTITGNILPSANDTYTLGDDDQRWADIYLGPGSLHIGTSTADGYSMSYDTTNERLGFNYQNSGNPEIVFDSSGNVGIGTTSPGEKLTVFGGDVGLYSDNPVIKITDSSSSTYPAWRISRWDYPAGTDPDNQYLALNYNSTGDNTIARDIDGQPVVQFTFEPLYKYGGEIIGTSEWHWQVAAPGSGVPSIIRPFGMYYNFDTSTGHADFSSGMNLRFADGTWIRSSDSGGLPAITGVAASNSLGLQTTASGYVNILNGGNTFAYFYGDAGGDRQLVIGNNKTFFIQSHQSLSQIQMGTVTNTPLWIQINNANKAIFDISGNFLLGTQATPGTNLAKGIAIQSGTAPTTSPADMIQMWSADTGGAAGKAGLHIRTEDGTTHVLGDLVGIGTTTPAGIFDVNGKLTVLSGGNVGIGTTTPGGALVIERNSATDATLWLNNSNTGSGAYSVLGINSNDNSIFIDTFGSTYTADPDKTNHSLIWSLGDGMILSSFSDTESGGIEFWTGTGLTRSLSERMRITNGGNVGIGTTTPGTKLQVAGVINSSLAASDTLGGGGFGLVGNNNMLRTGTNYRFAIDTWTTGSAWQESLTLLRDGNVGIGTTTPGQKLEVVGHIESTTGNLLTRLDAADTSDWSFGNSNPGGSLDNNLHIGNFLASRGTWSEYISVLASNGNVGIGTTSPASRLSIDGNNGLYAYFGAATYAIRGVFSHQGNSGGILDEGGLQIAAQGTNNATLGSGDIHFFTTGADSTGNFTDATYLDRMTIKYNGNVGIGTTTPGTKLQVAGVINSSLAASDTLGGGGFGLVGNNNMLRTGTNYRFAIDTWTTGSAWQESLTLLRDGNVGIGTTTPGAKLEVNGSIKMTGGSGGVLTFADGTTMSTAAGTGTGMTSTTDLTFAADSDANGSGAIFFSTAGSNRLTIINGGNVGIGTVSPGAKLEIVDTYSLKFGNNIFTGNSGASIGANNSMNIGVTSNNSLAFFTNDTLQMIIKNYGYVGIGTTNPQQELHILGNGINAGLMISDSAARVRFGMYSFASGNNEFGFGPVDLQIGTISDTAFSGFSEKMRITTGGNVGIGTTTPGSPLHVAGVSGAYTARVIGAGTAGNNYGVYIDAGLNSSDVGLRVDTAVDYSFVVRGDGPIRVGAYGAGTLTTDASGNVTASSDERLKNVTGSFDRGILAIMGLKPISYFWKASSGLDTKNKYSGFSAQNVRDFIPEAIDTDPRGYLTLSDRPILAAAVNAIQEQQGEISQSLALGSANSLALGEVSLQVSNQAQNINDQKLQVTSQSNTLSDLQAAVNEKLSVIGNMLDAQEISINKVKFDIEDFQKTFTTYQTEANNLFASLIETDRLLTDRITSLEDKIATLSVSGGGEVPANVVTQDTQGNVVLVGIFKAKDVQAETGSFKGALEAKSLKAEEVDSEGIVAGAFAVKTDADSEKKDTIGSGTILEVKNDDDDDGIDDDTGSDGKSVVIKNTAVKKDSKIFVTSRTMLDQPLVVTKIKDGESFTVEKKSPTNQDIDFDWWIIGSE